MGTTYYGATRELSLAGRGLGRDARPPQRAGKSPAKKDSSSVRSYVLFCLQHVPGYVSTLRRQSRMPAPVQGCQMPRCHMDSAGASPSVEGRGFLAPSEAEGSPATNGGASAPSFAQTHSFTLSEAEGQQVFRFRIGGGSSAPEGWVGFDRRAGIYPRQKGTVARQRQPMRCFTRSKW